MLHLSIKLAIMLHKGGCDIPSDFIWEFKQNNNNNIAVLKPYRVKSKNKTNWVYAPTQFEILNTITNILKSLSDEQKQNYQLIEQKDINTTIKQSIKLIGNNNEELINLSENVKSDQDYIDFLGAFLMELLLYVIQLNEK